MHYLRIILLFGIIILISSVNLTPQIKKMHLGFIPEPKYYGIGKWNSDSLGNHRAVIRVTKEEDAVMIYVPWRRHDENPEKKGVILIDSSTGKQIKNIHTLKIIREYGIFVFQPKTAPGTYYLYYFVPRTTGKNYPEVTYLPPKKSARLAWLKKYDLDKENPPPEKMAKLTKAELVQFQSIDEFNSFYPMEIIATKGEVNYLTRRNKNKSFMLFPEDRSNPIKMTKDLPFKWINEGPRDTFTAEVNMGEYFTFQIGLYAMKDSIKNIKIEFDDLTEKRTGNIIPSSAFTCFNAGGRDWEGKPFKKIISVGKGKIQPLWIGLDVPADVRHGLYKGSLTITPEGMESQTITLIFDVLYQFVDNHGDDDLYNMTRLRWLNSSLAQDDSVVSPFIPIKVNYNQFNILGREIHLGDNGLPASIKSYFASDVTRIDTIGKEILSSPIRFIVESNQGTDTLIHNPTRLNFIKKSPGEVVWEVKLWDNQFKINCLGKLEADGYIEIKFVLNPNKNINVKDIRLEIPFSRDAAKYMMGLGFKGGYRPKAIDWKWDVQKNQDAIWIGDVNAGMQCSFRDENYLRPLNTNFYNLKQLIMPETWNYQGRGGIKMFQNNDSTLLLTAYSGERDLKSGERLYYNFNLLITPFKPLDTRGQFTTRYYHDFKSVDEILSTGANVLNVHHATGINPYINYPFLSPEKMRQYIAKAHDSGLKVKIYYTVRELSIHSIELFALKSLGDEIFARGDGGGPAWCLEHLEQNYIGGWCVPEYGDASLINNGISRWHNYYVEGLNWLVKNCEIDGLYIDDVAFDRTTMKRIRKILDRNRPNGLIDLHSANQFNPRDGYASSANLYLEHFPYINRIWFGEYFDYNSSPDYWLVEISGIPFGLMGEMLQDGGNPWRGMVYGMTNRLPWAGDPRPLWKIMDEFGIHDSRMVGYWSQRVPVRTDNDSILATVYIRNNKTMVALASWASEKVDVKLTIDWKYLGLSPENSKISAPAIESFQPEAEFKVGEKIGVEPGKGWLLVISPK